ncbi:MAG: hypothetical protein AAGC95_17865 [Pseudomonadota bacterium]
MLPSLRLMLLVLIASAFAPGNPLFGLRLGAAPDPYEMLPIKACEEITMSCIIGGRALYGLRVQAAFVAGLAYDWLAVEAQGRINAPRLPDGFSLPFAPTEHMSMPSTDASPDAYDI